MKNVFTKPAWAGRTLSVCSLIVLLLLMPLYSWAQGPDKDKDKIKFLNGPTSRDKYKIKIKPPKLPPKKLDEKLLKNARYNFKVSP